MNRLLTLKIVLALVGLLFIALIYPMLVFVRQDPALSMMFSLYVTLGIFLLLAIRNPSANRSLIAFTAWSSLATQLSWARRHGSTWLPAENSSAWPFSSSSEWFSSRSHPPGPPDAPHSSSVLFYLLIT